MIEQIAGSNSSCIKRKNISIIKIDICKRAFYRTGCARGWPRRRVTPGPSGIIGTA
jgi:hypothetical protein